MSEPLSHSDREFAKMVAKQRKASQKFWRNLYERGAGYSAAHDRDCSLHTCWRDEVGEPPRTDLSKAADAVD